MEIHFHFRFLKIELSWFSNARSTSENERSQTLNYRSIGRFKIGKQFDFLGLFISMLSGKKKKEMLLVFDPSFISKSGKHTYGLARSWNGKVQRAEKG